MREKLFGPGRAVPLDRNAKVRVIAYARAWSARNRAPGQHRGPLTRATIEVLQALLWGFHNARSGRCYPGYDAIARRAGCCRSTVHLALRALEAAGVMSWCNRLFRFGERVMRTSNAYVFNDPGVGAESENRHGTPNQESSLFSVERDPAEVAAARAALERVRGLRAGMLRL